MKITIVSHEMPYPPFHGGRVDIWRRIKAFANCGAQLQLICWLHNLPTAPEKEEIDKYVEESIFLPYKKQPVDLLKRAIDLTIYPLEVTSRIVRGSALKKIVDRVKSFSPEVIFVDGIPGGLLGIDLSKNLNIPMVTRSHNIEHLYHQRLLNSTEGLKKLKKYLSVNHLENYEKFILANSLVFYDISADDLKFWQEEGLTNGSYLPPLIEFSTEQNPISPENCPYDVVFLGNLNSANNVSGVTWLIEEVTPLLQAEIPDIKILIAGSNPIPEIQQLCQQNSNVELKINPPSAAAIYSSGKVLVNPIFTGSGVSIKSIEMLAAGKPIVSAPQGLAGLPLELKQYFKIAVDAESFTKEIIKCLSQPSQINVDRTLLESLLGNEAIKKMLSELKNLIKKI